MEYDQSDQRTDHSGMVSDQSPDQSPEPLHANEAKDKSDASTRMGVGGEGGGEAVDAKRPGGGTPHYYLKLSSTLETSNGFVDRSLPFFVPPASSR